MGVGGGVVRLEFKVDDIFVWPSRKCTVGAKMALGGSDLAEEADVG